MNVWKKNSSWKPIFSTSKLQHVAGSVNLLVPSGRGCMFDCDKLWLQGSTYIHVFSLCDVSDVSLTHTIFLPNTSEEPLGEKKKKKNRREEGQCKPTLKWATSRIQTAAFDDSWFYFLGTLLLSNILQRIYQLKYFTITVETITYCIHYSMGWWW